MFIRYFAATNEEQSELGHAARAFLAAMVELEVPVRLASTQAAHMQTDAAGRSSNPWSKYSDLFVTPLDGDYVNAICSPPSDWGKFHTRSKACKKNVLLCAPHIVLDQASLVAGLLYDEIVVTTPEDAELWAANGGSPTLVLTQDDFRRVMLT